MFVKEVQLEIKINAEIMLCIAHIHKQILEVVNPLSFTVPGDRTHFYVCKCSLNTILTLWHKDNVCLCNKTAEPGVGRQKFIVISIYDDTHQHKTHSVYCKYRSHPCST